MSRRTTTSAVVAAALAAAALGAVPAAAEPAPPGAGTGAHQKVRAVQIPSAKSIAGAAGAAGVSQATRLVPQAPQRVLDTRIGLGRAGTSPVAGGSQFTVALPGAPADAVAVVLNVTGTGGTADTYVTAWESGVARPEVSTINLAAGETRANAATTFVGPNGTVNFYNNSGSTHLVADVAGYYVAYSPPAVFDPTTKLAAFFRLGPSRAYDSRWGGNPFSGGETRTVDLRTVGVPANATAVSLNITGVDGTVATHVTAWPTGQARPTASSLNLARGAITPNNVTVAVGPDAKIDLYNNAGHAHLIVDVAGYYAPYGGQSNNFYPVNPQRTFDSRELDIPMGPGEEYVVFYNADPFESTELANVTSTGATSATHVTAFPTGNSRPNTSVLNLVRGQTAANMATVGVGSYYDEYDGRWYAGQSYYNNAGWAHLIVDTFGWFE